MTIQQSPIYEKFVIISTDGRRSVTADDAQFRVTDIYYYENILSPNITGMVELVSTIGVSNSADDIQDRVGSLHSYLPLEVGCELLLKVKNYIGEGLDFSSTTNPHKRFYINEVQVLEKTSTSERLRFRFVSRIGWTNPTKRVTRHFDGRISESVKNILKNDLKLTDDLIQVDDSSNSYSFAGMTQRPFDLLGMLAKQTIPQNTAGAGYFCYETKSGFKYISADTLINSNSYPENYNYNAFVESSYQASDVENQFKIESLTVSQDQNLLNQIRTGIYATKTIFFNPATFDFTEIDISVDNDKLYKNPKFSTLGKTPSIPNILKEEFNYGNRFHRVETAILNIGADKETTTPNNNPEFYFAAAAARYNLLFSQQTSILIMGNTDLEAGEVLNLIIEDISSRKEMGPDQKQSGRYIIGSLCHHFNPEKSETSLGLLRDSYGLHSSQTT
tara:strand:+ start:649 stop:1986 length:1338 start_codon:yes stop_codon:yes gene_type:complete